MKNKFTYILLIAFSISLNSQVIENKIPMSMGVQNGFTLAIPETDAKIIDKVWKKYTKDYGRLTKKKKTEEQMLTGVRIPNIAGEHEIDVYMISENNSANVFFDLRTGFVNSTEYPQEYTAATEFVKEFGYEVQREIVGEQLKNEEDLLKKLTRQLDNLISDHKKYHEDIEDAKAKIKKAENNIVVNEKDQVQTKILVSEKSKTLEAIERKYNRIGKPE